MAIKVLVVDDSSFFRRRMSEIINADPRLTVVGNATNGKEAQDGDILRAGVAYLAPGGQQMMVDGRAPNARLRIIDSGELMNYKPCVDVTFGSAAKVFNDRVLSIVLTGMGADGRDGARMLKANGSTVWAQDEESCVVYGMPQAVAKAGISSHDLPLDRIAECILIELGLS
ncbi:chemotaxis protein CheB [Photobacterium phosphoreum]|uniref:chemotaxis protein CheB n=1 Tax=Photobacterium phosphoreum TaxID=659 RepID=UPI0024B792F3|nr:chemotaxis protein CheB [Photobacterium phosphoreum]